MSYQEQQPSVAKLITSAVLGVLLVAVTCMIGCPTYNVYTSKKQGEAMLAHAISSKEVKVAEAKANMESAIYNAQADTIRAHGIARANIIIGKSLTDKYLHWYFIDNIEKNPQATIYIPTEAGMPIMEANRFKGKNYTNDKDTASAE